VKDAEFIFMPRHHCRREKRNEKWLGDTGSDRQNNTFSVPVGRAKFIAFSTRKFSTAAQD
jgi:hypothetical protein